jgi:hypothetical protein
MSIPKVGESLQLISRSIGAFKAVLLKLKSDRPQAYAAVMNILGHVQPGMRYDSGLVHLLSKLVEEQGGSPRNVVWDALEEEDLDAEAATCNVPQGCYIIGEYCDEEATKELLTQVVDPDDIEALSKTAKGQRATLLGTRKCHLLLGEGNTLFTERDAREAVAKWKRTKATGILLGQEEQDFQSVYYPEKAGPKEIKRYTDRLYMRAHDEGDALTVERWEEHVPTVYRAAVKQKMQAVSYKGDLIVQKRAQAAATEAEPEPEPQAAVALEGAAEEDYSTGSEYGGDSSDNASSVVADLQEAWRARNEGKVVRILIGQTVTASAATTLTSLGVKFNPGSKRQPIGKKIFALIRATVPARACEIISILEKNLGNGAAHALAAWRSAPGSAHMTTDGRVLSFDGIANKYPELQRS